MYLVRNALAVALVALVVESALVAARPSSGVDERGLLVNLAPAVEGSSVHQPGAASSPSSIVR